MPTPALEGITTTFTLNASTATQLALPNGGRIYAIVINTSGPITGTTAQTVWLACGTNNNAVSGCGIPIPASSYYEVVGSAVKGDLSAIAVQGAPTVCITTA